MDYPFVAGADIGGSHVTTALVSSAQNDFVPGTLHRVRINSGGSAAAIIHGWAAALQKSMQSLSHPVAVGLAMPGPFDYVNGISHITGLHKYEALYGLPVKDLLADALGILPAQVRMNNDAACFLQGELLRQQLPANRLVLGVTLGTGLGSAIADKNGVREAGLYARMFAGMQAEEHFSTRWLLSRYAALGGEPAKDVKTIAANAENDALAVQLFREFGSNLAQFINEWEFTPGIVVLGGNIAQAAHLFLPSLQHELSGRQTGISFVLSQLGELAPVLGAAGLWRV